MLNNMEQVSTLTCSSYILEEKVYETRPLINLEDAHFNICFSCVAYLNTSYGLIPLHYSNDTRAAIVVTGFHGLQIYANQFWVDHLLSYCTILDQQRKNLSRELENQLNTLLRFLKESASVEQTPDYAELEGLDVLVQNPNIKTLVLKVAKFRRKLEVDDALSKSDKSAAGRWIKSINKILKPGTEICQIRL